MADLPHPPPIARLRAIPVREQVLPPRWRCWRIYTRAGPGADEWGQLRYFGPTDARFDHHEPPPREQPRGVLYAAAEPDTCFAEVFQDRRTIERSRDEPWLAGFELERPIRLLDLTGDWPTEAGASAAICSGPHRRCRELSRAIYDAYPDVEGLYYLSSVDGGGASVLLYERAANALPGEPVFHRPLMDESVDPLVERVARELGYTVE